MDLAHTLPKRRPLTISVRIEDYTWMRSQGLKHSWAYQKGVEQIKDRDSLQNRLVEIQDENEHMAKRIQELSARLFRLEHAPVVEAEQ